MIDVFEAGEVEIIIDWDGQKIWVNSEEGCLLRIYRIKNLVLNDMRTTSEQSQGA